MRSFTYSETKALWRGDSSLEGAGFVDLRFTNKSEVDSEPGGPLPGLFREGRRCAREKEVANLRSDLYPECVDQRNKPVYLSPHLC